MQPCIYNLSSLVASYSSMVVAAVGERLQRSDEIAGGGDREMRQQGGAIGPLLEKHQPQRIFAIDMHGVGDAAGLGARTMHVFEAQFPHFVKLSSRAVTLPVTTIMSSSRHHYRPSLWRACALRSSGCCGQRFSAAWPASVST